MYEEYYPIPPSGEHPDRYSAIPSIYGPGAYVAWNLAAYSVLTQISDAPKHAQSRRNLDRNLVLTLVPSLFAAGHLVYQISRYPDPVSQIWSTNDENLIPLVTPIYASAQFCVDALGVQLLFTCLMYKLRLRQCIVASTSLPVAGALCYAGLRGEQWSVQLTRGVKGTLLSAFMLPVTMFAVWNFVVGFLAMVGARVVRCLVALKQLQLKQFLLDLLWCVFAPPYVAIGMYVVVVYIGIGNAILWPKTQHDVRGMGQILAILAGLVNVVVSVRLLARNHMEVVREKFPYVVGWV